MDPVPGVDALLRSAGWPGHDRQPDPQELHDTRQILEGSLRRTVSQSDLWHAQAGAESSGTLLVIDTEAAALYRVTLRLDGDATTLEVEMIDLARRVVRVAVTERRYLDSTRPVLKSRWHFEFEGADPVDINDEETDAGDGPSGKPYVFGRALAEAAGWAST